MSPVEVQVSSCLLYIYLGSAEHCNLVSEIEVNHLQVPIRQCFYREKNYVGRAIVNKESLVFLVAESFPRSRRSLLFVPG